MGTTGQNESFSTEFLPVKGYQVPGIVRGGVPSGSWRKGQGPGEPECMRRWRLQVNPRPVIARAWSYRAD